MLAVQMAVVHTLFVSSNRFALSRFMELSSPSIRYRPISAILVAADSTARFLHIAAILIQILLTPPD